MIEICSGPHHILQPATVLTPGIGARATKFNFRMRLDRLITLGVVKPVGRAWGRFPALNSGTSRANGTLPVLMYHSISDDTEPAFSPYYKVCTSPRRFAEHMQWLAEAGWRGVTLSEGLAWLNAKETAGNYLQAAAESPERNTFNQQTSAISRSNQSPDFASASSGETHHSALGPHHSDSPPVKLVAITFDDGFRDFHTAAFPILRQHGFSATMYLPTAFIGDEPIRFKERECLTWAEVEELQQAGMEFGSHTVNHPVLVKLDWPEIEMELRDSKTTLEKRLKRPVRAFAYPYAFPQTNRDFRTRFLEVLRTAGYESCVTTEIGTMLPGDELLQIKRLPVNECDDANLLRAKLTGAYDWMGGPQKMIKRLKSLRLHTEAVSANS
jgi:peptidoglycan/xylan/chitin deacetylase (PgdA/CDA1 family)